MLARAAEAGIGDAKSQGAALRNGAGHDGVLTLTVDHFGIECFSMLIEHGETRLEAGVERRGGRLEDELLPGMGLEPIMIEITGLLDRADQSRGKAHEASPRGLFVGLGFRRFGTLRD